jgi:hypothetical protein
VKGLRLTAIAMARPFTLLVSQSVCVSVYLSTLLHLLRLLQEFQTQIEHGPVRQ